MAKRVLTCGNEDCKQKNNVDMDRLKAAYCGKCSFPMYMAVELQVREDEEEESVDDLIDEMAGAEEDDEPEEDEEDDSEEEAEEIFLCPLCGQTEVPEEGRACSKCLAAQKKAAKGKAGAKKPASKGKTKPKVN